MSDLKEKRTAEAVSFPVKLREFLLSAINSKSLLCVFEGQDHLYYGPRIDHHAGSTFKRKNFYMGGKKNVIRLYNLKEANAEVAAARAIYFVDRDYDAPLTQTRPDFYTTLTYSVENYYVSVDSFEKIICDALCIPLHRIVGDASLEPHPDYENAFRFLEKSILDYHEQLGSKLHAFIQAVRLKIGETESLNLKKFDAEQFGTFYELNHKGFSLKRPPNRFELSVSLGLSVDLISEEMFVEEQRKAASVNLWIDGRGKFIFRVFLDALAEIWVDVRRTKPKILKREYAPAISFDAKTALGNFSNFAATPDDLTSFLKDAISEISRGMPTT